MSNIKWLIGICDDEIYYRNEILERCKEYGKNKEIQLEFVMFEDGEDVLNCEKIIDILFLDIRMKRLGGLDIIQEIRIRDNVWKVIFVTGHSEEALNGYGSKTIGFLTKPLNIERLYDCLDMVKFEYLKNEIISFRIDGNDKIEKINNIIYIEGRKNYVMVFTYNGCFLTYGTIKYWQSQLKKFDIIRIHKSYLVSLRNIKQINENLNKIHVRGIEKILPVGRTYRKEIKDKIRYYRINKVKERLI